MNETPWNLIAAYLSGNASEEEQQAMHAWIKEKPENEKLFNEAKACWKLTAKGEPSFSPNVEEAWRQLKSKIEEKERLEIKSSSYKPMWLKIAAAVALLAGAGYFIRSMFISDAPVEMENIITRLETGDTARAFYLPDSSFVKLNKNSLITYQSSYKSQRDVALSGEAFFEVKRDTASPFAVTAGGTVTTVKGTSFNIKAYEDKNEVEVSVVTGSVEFSETGSEKKTMISRGETIEFNKKDASMSRRKNKRNNWWEHGKLEKEINRLFKKIKRK